MEKKPHTHTQQQQEKKEEEEVEEYCHVWCIYGLKNYFISVYAFIYTFPLLFSFRMLLFYYNLIQNSCRNVWMLYKDEQQQSSISILKTRKARTHTRISLVKICNINESNKIVILIFWLKLKIQIRLWNFNLSIYEIDKIKHISLYI